MVIIWSGPIWLELSMLGHFQIWHLWMHKPKFGPLKQKLHRWGKTPLANDTNVPRKYSIMTVLGVPTPHTHTHPSPHILLTAVTGASKCYSQTLLHRQKSDSKSAFIFIHQCTVCFGVHIYLPTSVLFFSYKLWWNSHNFVKIILSLLLFASYK